MRRITVLALSVILALVVAAPIASAQNTSEQQTDLGELAAGWWKWALKKPTQVNPLVGDYTWPEQPRAGAKCAGGSSLGVWNLAGTLGGDATRTCKAPAGKPIFFPVFNVICSPLTLDTGDLQECAENFTDQALAGSSPYARVDGQDVPFERVASDVFTVTVPKNHVFKEFFGTPPGAYPAATDGLWAYLPEGLSKGEHVIEYGGVFTNPFFDPNDPSSSPTFEINITYYITVR